MNTLRQYGEWGINLKSENKKNSTFIHPVPMMDSIRMKLMLILFFVVSGIFVVYFILNHLFLEEFYMHSKQDTVMEAYETMEAIVETDSNKYLITETDQNELSAICETYGVALVIVGTDNRILYQYGNGMELRRRLTMIDFGIKIEETVLIQKTESYVFQSIAAKNDDYGYLELYGHLEGNRIFLMRTAVESIHESAKLSRIFFLYVGLGILVVSMVIVYVISAKFTRPILDLAHLSERMSNLDFNAKYEPTSEDEISVLGNSMNVLSERLKENIVELKNANNQLQRDIAKREEIDEMRKDFISNVSHELKTPIALIQGYAEGLSECIHDDAESREFYCEVIMDEAEKMNKLVKNLLMLNQLEFGNSTIQFERFDIVQLIDGVLSSLDYMIKQNDITVIFSNQIPVYVYADEFQIEGVVTNYITNAIHHAQGKKELRITLEQNEKTVCVRVYNSGTPIPEEELDKIWIKFYKVDKARTREYGGSGIGLSIVKAIMKSHGQNCGVLNHEDGVEFWFELDAELA